MPPPPNPIRLAKETVPGTVCPNYNTRPRPAEVLVNGAEGSGAELIRERETVEGLMAGEKV